MDSDEKYYRSDWMSDDQYECAKMFASVLGGFHHVNGTFKQCGRGIKIHHYGGSFATFDYYNLTRLVVIAHDEMVRVELIPSGPGRLGFAMWKRHGREGGVEERHPTIEQAIAMHRPKLKEQRHD